MDSIQQVDDAKEGALMGRPAHYAHADVADDWGLERLQEILPDEAEQLSQEPFAHYNVRVHVVWPHA